MKALRLCLLLTTIALGLGLPAVEPKLEAGNAFSVYLADDGSVWTWGDNFYGQLGDGSTTDRLLPAKITSFPEPIVDIAVGWRHVVALDATGDVWVWGHNSSGQRGDGSAGSSSDYMTSPVQVTSLTYVREIASGAFHCLAIDNDGVAYAWGDNSQYQCGIGGTSTSDVLTPTAVVGGHTWRELAGGRYHSMGIASDGTVYAWGDDFHGQLGDASGDSGNQSSPVAVAITAGDVRDIACGFYHSLALRTNGLVYAWGDNAYGQCGPGGTIGTDVFTPIYCSVSAGSDVGGGYYHSWATRSNGALAVWGRNHEGQLRKDPGTTTESESIINYTSYRGAAEGQCADHMLVITQDGSLYSWGDNNDGQLGRNATSSYEFDNVRAQAGWAVDRVAQVAMGRYHSHARTSGGTVWSWGSNSLGQGGDGGGATYNTAPREVTGISGVIDVDAGNLVAEHSLATLGTSQVYAWGSNTYGQHGDGTTDGHTTPQQVASSLRYVQSAGGGFHSLGLTDSGLVRAWGRDAYGQLGNDSTLADQLSPVAVSGLSDIVQVSAGYLHSLALRADGTVWAWGYNGVGTLGDGTTTNRSTPVQVSGLTDVVHIAAGGYHNLAVTADGRVWAWGYNLYGQIGDGTTTNRTTPVPVEFASGFAISFIKQVAAGAYHSYCLENDGDVWAWGRGNEGQLGDGATSDNLDADQISLADPIYAIEAGQYSGIFLKADGTVLAVGDNGFYQLGDGTTTDRTTPVSTQPDWLPVVSVDTSGSTLTASETGPGTAQIKIVRDGSIAGALEVSYTTSIVSGSGGAGSDYQTPTGTVTIPAGQSSVLVAIDVIDDAIDEADSEKFRLTLNASADRYRLDSANSADFTVTDNDVAGITVSPTSGLETDENGNTDSFTIVLATQPTANVTVNLSSSNTGEGTVSPTSVTFTSTTWSSPQTITVTGVDDQVDDDNVSYTIITSTAVSTDAKYNGINPSDVGAKNLDNDTAGFTVTTDGAPVLESPLASGNSDGNGNTLVVNDVSIADVQVGMRVEIRTGTAAGTITTVTAVDSGTGTLTLASSLWGSSENVEAAIGKAAYATLVLDTKPTAGVSVSIGVSDSSEGTASPNLLSFDDSNWSTPQTITLFGVDDFLDDGDQGYNIQLASATSSDPKYNGLDPSDVAVTTVDDDARGIVITGSSTAVTEGGSNDTYTVRLASQPTGTVTVNLAPQNGEVSVTPTSIGFSTTSWDNPVTVTVTAIDDAFIETGENGLVRHSASGADYAGLTPVDHAVTVTSDDVAGAVVSPTSLSITEGLSANFTVELSASPQTSTIVAITADEVGDSIARLGSHPSATTIYFSDASATGDGSSSVSPRPWNSPHTLTVTAQSDANSSDEATTITLSLDGGNTTDGDFSTIDPDDVAITNKDDDTPGITITETDGSTAVVEGSATDDTYQVKLNTDPGGLVAVSVNAGSGVSVTPTVLYFDATDFGTNQTVTVSVDDDDLDEATTHSTTIAHAISATTSGTYPTTLSLPSLGVTITDDDTAGISVSAPANLTVTEGGATATFSVVLDSQPTNTVEIDFTSNDTSEATVSPATVTFTASNWASSQTVTVTGVDDDLDDDDISFVIAGVVDAANTLDDNYDGRNVAAVPGTTIDDDSVGVQLVESGGSTVVDESGTTDTYTIALTSEPTGTVTVSLDADNQVLVQPAGAGSATSTSAVYFGTSAASGNGLASATPRAWNNAITITVSAVDDDTDEATTHSGSIGHSTSGADYSGVAVASLSVDVGDDADDDAGIELTTISGSPTEATGGSFTLTSSSTTSATKIIAFPGGTDLSSVFVGQQIRFEGGGANDTVQTQIVAVDDGADTVTVLDAVSDAGAETVLFAAGFRVRLQSQPLATVVVKFLSNDASEGFASPASHSFGPGNWNTYQTVNVIGEDDDVDDGDVTFAIEVSEVQSLDPNYNGNEPASGVSVTTIDDDSRGFTFTGAGSGDLVTTEIGGSDSFTLVLDSQPTATVTIGLASSDSNQGTVSPASLTFTTSDWDRPQTVTVTGADGDGVDNGADPGTSWSVVTTNTTASGNYAGDAIADPTVANHAANHEPTIDTPAALSIDEDSGLTTVDLSGISEGQNGEESQTVSITAASSDTDIIPDPSVTYTDGDTTGQISFTPVADANGSAVIVLTVTDSGGTADGGDDTVQVSFTVTVGPVNDAPEVDTDGDGSTGDGHTAAFTEGGGAVVIADPALAITDIDDTVASSATVSLAAIPDGSAESLSVTVGSTGISQTYNASTGVLSLTASGSPPLADWETVLRTLTYDNTSGDPDTSTRSVSVVVNDGTDNSAADVISVTVSGIDFEPLIDLNGGLAGIDDSASYSEGDGASSVTSPALAVTDSDSNQLASATVTITNLLDTGAETLAVNTTGTAISQSFATASGTGTLTLTGPAPVADFQSVLRTLTYHNTSEDPDGTSRAIDFVVVDSSSTASNATNAAARLTLTVTPVNDAPVVTVNTGATLAIGDTIAVDETDIDASDVDDPLSSLAFSLLLIPSQGNLEKDAGAGFAPMALGDSFTRDDLVNGRIRYVHTALTSADDGFAFEVTDGADPSDLSVFNITVTGLSPPVITLSSTSTLTYTENDPALTIDSNATVTDADSADFDGGSLTVSLANAESDDRLWIGTALGVSVVDNGASYSLYFSGASDAFGTISDTSGSNGSGGGNLVVSLTAFATPTETQALVRSIQYRHLGDNPLNASRTVSMVLNDGGNDSATVNRGITVVAVNDPPQVSSATVVALPTFDRTGSLTITDPDTPSGDLLVSVTAQPSKASPITLDASYAFTYTALVGTQGSDTFTVRVDDQAGGVTSYDAPVVISGSGSSNLQVNNNPPYLVLQDDPLLYTPQVDGLAAGATLTFELIGLDASSDPDLNFNTADGTINWGDVPAVAGDYYEFGILITDTTNAEALYLPIVLHVYTVPPG